MQDISVRLSNSHFCTALPQLVEELYNAPLEHINITFWGGIKLTLPNHQASISLDDIISKVESMYKIFKPGITRNSYFYPCSRIQSTLRMYYVLEERVSQKIQTAYKITKIFLKIREFFGSLWFDRNYSAERLNDISLKLIPLFSTFHVSSVSKILSGGHCTTSTGKFVEQLSAELPNDAVVLTTCRINSLATQGIASIELIDKPEKPEEWMAGRVDILATKDENLSSLKTYLVNNNLAHRYTLISLDELKEKLSREYDSSIMTPTNMPFPYWWQKRDYFLR